MAKGDLTLGGVALPLEGIKYSPGWIDYEKTARTINNTLVSDLVAFKRKFSISWENPLDGAFMADLLDMYVAKEDLTFTETQSDLTTLSYTVHIDIGSEYLREIYSGNYAFSGFKITLEEV